MHEDEQSPPASSSFPLEDDGGSFYGYALVVSLAFVIGSIVLLAFGKGA